MNLDLDHLRAWIGRSQEAAEVLTPRLANSLDAVLDGAADLREGDIAPLGIHWCLAPDIVPMSLLGDDGHPRRGDFLPPVPLPRRMWAGGNFELLGSFRIGETIRRSSRIADVTTKASAQGSLCFVAVLHE